MNIALFSDTYLPDINGVATSTKILRDELVKHGHHVMVVTTTIPHDATYNDTDDYILRLPGIDLKKMYGYRASNIYSFKGMKEIKDFNPDIIHIQTEFGIGIFGKIVGEILNIPVVYTYHTMWSDYSHYLVPDGFKIADTMAKKFIEKYSKIYSDSCAAIIVPSKKTADALSEYGVHKEMHVIPTGLVLDKFDKENENNSITDKIKKEYNLNDKFVVTFLGRIAQEKSIDFIIDALEEVIKVNNNIVLMIVGGGPQEDVLKQYVSDKNMNEYIIFTGPKDPNIVPSFYHVSDLFVSASLSETQGLTFIEAMASSVPVLARYDKNLDGVIINGLNGFFFENKDELVQYIIELSQKDISELKLNSKIEAMKHSSVTFYNKVISVYQKISNKHHYIYKVKSIFPDKNNSSIVTFIVDKHTIEITLSDAVIERYGLYVDQVIDREELEALKDQEKVAMAYKDAVKYLMYKDYTYSKLKSKLEAKMIYDDIQIDMTMDLLMQKGLIDDKAYTEHYFQKAIKLGIGISKIVYNLKNEGISPFIIDEYLMTYSNEIEIDKAMDIIDKLFKENKTKPTQALIQAVRNKLFLKGFTKSVVEDAISNFDFTMPKEHTKQLLVKEYHRVLERYKKRYDNRTLKSKIITFLVQKGYEYDDVVDVISELWEDFNG